MGMGGLGYVTGADTFSSYFNPAGLGYVARRMFGFAFRNLPTSRTTASGQLSDPLLVSRSDGGNLGITHLGYAMPMRGRGTVGIAMTLNGYVDDQRSGNGLDLGGGLRVDNYSERIRVRNDFISVGYGKASPNQTFSWGISGLYVMSSVKNRQTGDILDGAGNLVGTLDVDNNETGGGFGVVGGVQFSPRNSSNMSVGLSFRSEINLTNNDNTSAIYDKIPARLAGGIVLRRDGLRGGRDYLVYGGEVQHYFRGESSPILDRSDTQTTAGIGLEYNYVGAFGRIPVRLGFYAVPSGGHGFRDRNSLTFGIGYRPAGSDLSVDLNFGQPEPGGTDVSISISYRFK